MKKIRATLFLVVFLAAGAVGVYRSSGDSFSVRARTLRVGDSKKKVEQLLGRPIQIFVPQPDVLARMLLGGVDDETWVYGSRFHFRQPFHGEFPYFSPSRLVRFRFGGPD